MTGNLPLQMPTLWTTHHTSQVSHPNCPHNRPPRRTATSGACTCCCRSGTRLGGRTHFHLGHKIHGQWKSWVTIILQWSVFTEWRHSVLQHGCRIAQTDLESRAVTRTMCDHHALKPLEKFTEKPLCTIMKKDACINEYWFPLLYM